MKKQTITSDFIRNALGDLRMTARQLAIELEIREETISLWKNGKAKPSGDLVLRILKMVKDKQDAK